MPSQVTNASPPVKSFKFLSQVSTGWLAGQKLRHVSNSLTYVDQVISNLAFKTEVFRNGQNMAKNYLYSSRCRNRKTMKEQQSQNALLLLFPKYKLAGLGVLDIQSDIILGISSSWLRVKMQLTDAQKSRYGKHKLRESHKKWQQSHTPISCNVKFDSRSALNFPKIVFQLKKFLALKYKVLWSAM